MNSHRNARKEFEDHAGNPAGIKCAALYWGDPKYPGSSWGSDEGIFLHPGFSEQDYHQFLQRIDTDYDAGYGGQELFGTIWYTDGSWSDRREYDGAEWWEHQTAPDYPDEFNHACITVMAETAILKLPD